MIIRAITSFRQAIAPHYYMHFDDTHNSMSDNSKRTKQRETVSFSFTRASRIDSSSTRTRSNDFRWSERTRSFLRLRAVVATVTFVPGGSRAISRKRDRILRGSPRFISCSSRPIDRRALRHKTSEMVLTWSAGATAMRVLV